MGTLLQRETADAFLERLRETSGFMPQRYFLWKGASQTQTASGTERFRGGDEIVWDKKSDYSFKEVLLPISQTILYFTEDEMKVPKEEEKGNLILVRSCDLHSVRRLDEIYLKNGAEDYYYKRIRENTRFILMGCPESFDSCICVSMGTNKSTDYDAYPRMDGQGVYLDCRDEELGRILKAFQERKTEIPVEYVTKNPVQTEIPEELPAGIQNHDMWKEYTGRCIGCGRCNFVCPTCTCFTMQDIFYKDNDRTGERRRVWVFPPGGRLYRYSGKYQLPAGSGAENALQGIT